MAISIETNAAVGSNSANNPWTVAFTAGTGTNRLLVLFLFNEGGADGFSSITYGGAAMTSITSVAVPVEAGGTRTLYAYYLIAPATGANNFVITRNTAGNALRATAISLAGAAQSSQPDVSNTGTENAGDGAFSVAVTTTEAGVGVVGAADNEVFGAPGAGANTTQLNTQTNMSQFQLTTFPSGAGGSYTMAFTGTGSGTADMAAGIVVGFKAVAAAGPSNLKSLDTNVKANIKSYNTNVLANIKSINTNA